MKILLIYKKAHWIDAHVIPSFCALPVQVDCLDLRDRGDIYPSLSPAVQMSAAISKGGGYDLIFMLEVTDDIACLRALSAARRNGSIICNYLVDVPQDWWRSIDVARVCNVVLVAQKENANRLKRAENQVIYFPFAVSEQFIRATCPVIPNHTSSAIRQRAVFVGSGGHARWRWRLLAELDKAEIPIDVVGPGWTNKLHMSRGRSGFHRLGILLSQLSVRHHIERLSGSGGWSAVAGAFIHNFIPMPKINFKNTNFIGFLDDEMMYQSVRRAAVNVSTSVHGSGYLIGYPKRQFKLRDIEFPCLGTPFLTDGSPELCEVLDVKNDVVLYSGRQELINLVRDICRFPDTYRDLPKRAREQIMRKHTWRVRLEDLSRIVDLKIL